MMRFPDNPHSDAASEHYPQDGDFLAGQGEIQNSDSTSILPLETPVAHKLSTAKEYAQMGQLQYAYQLSYEATVAAPDNIDAWLLRGAFAESSEECFVCMSKAIALAPQHSGAKHSMYNTLKRYLDQNPHLQYIEETDSVYRVLTGEERAIVVSKDRAISPFQPIFRWLVLSMLGLLLAGLGAVVCAPIASVKAWRISQQPLSAYQRRQVRMALLYADVLFVMGLLLSYVLLLHL